MREILFRAKRKDNGEWVEGYLFEFQPGQYMICDKKEYDRPSTMPVLYFFKFCSYEIEISTLCQYTGLTDKKGQKIWENDIVKCPKRKEEYELYRVVWRNDFADFGVEPVKPKFEAKYPIGLSEERTIYGRDYKIIGNVFDEGVI